MPNKSVDRISELAQSVLEDTDFFLVDIEIKGGKKTEIWINVDGHERSINMDECAAISNELSFLMDAHELFNGSYRLNVSSPGLNRPLVDRRQYSKNIGREAKVKIKNEEAYTTVKGTLKQVYDDKIVIERSKNTPLEVSFDKIIETKIIPSLK